MPAPVAIDHYQLFDDVVAVARKSHAPTAGWRAICVRAQRTVGKAVVQSIAGLDLGEEVPSLSERVRALARRAPSDIDTLVFGLFDGIAVESELVELEPAGRPNASVYTGFHVGGMAGFDPDVRWLPKAPSYLPADRFLASPSLDAVYQAGLHARGDAKKAVLHALRFGAAALLARFAAETLPYRIVVTFDDGDFAEISEGRSATSQISCDR